MANNTGLRTMAGSISTTADTLSFGRKVRQVAIINHHATQRIWAKLFSSSVSEAAAIAAAAADVAVADADENFVCRAGRTVIFKSKKPLFFAASIIAETGATTYHAVGTEWTDGE